MAGALLVAGAAYGGAGTFMTANLALGDLVVAESARFVGELVPYGREVHGVDRPGEREVA